MNRRSLLASLAVGAGATLAGCSESCDRTLIRPWLGNTENFTTMRYLIERDRVVVDVGSQGNGGHYAFDPPGIVIRAGTTVRWEWTGRGGPHRIVDECGRFESGSAAATDHTFDESFDRPGIYTYACEPHSERGMRGAIRVE